MFKEVFNIIRVTKPRHIFKALISPSNTIEAIKYHYRRVSEREFVKCLAGQWNCSSEAISLAYQDYENNIALWEEIKEEMALYPDGYAMQMTSRELPVLYVLIRLVKPDCIVETGVSSGASSAYILQALHDNRSGKLCSIDVPPDNLPAGKESGWVVPHNLRSRWTLQIGDSKDLLGPLLQELGEIDCFIHDSLHTYEHMTWEFRTAWEYLKPGSLFVSHDIGANKAFFELMKDKKIAWKDYRIFNLLGGFQKK